MRFLFAFIACLYGLTSSSPITNSINNEATLDDFTVKAMNPKSFEGNTFNNAGETKFLKRNEEYFEQHYFRLAHRLESIIHNLRTYLHGKEFEARRFSLEADEIEKDIEILGKSVAKFPHKQGLTQMLSFSQHMFRVMKSSKAKLDVFTDSKDPGIFWIRSLINHNCRALLMFNSYGRPNSRIQGFERKVLINWRFMWFAKIHFENTKGVLSDDVIMFQHEHAQAYKTIELLAREIPGYM